MSLAIFLHAAGLLLPCCGFRDCTICQSSTLGTFSTLMAHHYWVSLYLYLTPTGCTPTSLSLYPHLTFTLPLPVVVVNPLLPAYWGGGESVSVALWGFAASFSRQSSSRAATPEGSLHKSRADSVVRPYPLLISILLPICPTLPPSYPNFTPPPPHPHRALISPQSYPHFTPTLPHLTPTSPPPHPHLTPTSPPPHPHLTHTLPTPHPHLALTSPHSHLTLPSHYHHLTLTLPSPYPHLTPVHPHLTLPTSTISSVVTLTTLHQRGFFLRIHGTKLIR